MNRTETNAALAANKIEESLWDLNVILPQLEEGAYKKCIFKDLRDSLEFLRRIVESEES